MQSLSPPVGEQVSDGSWLSFTFRWEPLKPWLVTVGGQGAAEMRQEAEKRIFCVRVRLVGGGKCVYKDEMLGFCRWINSGDKSPHFLTNWNSCFYFLLTRKHSPLYCPHLASPPALRLQSRQLPGSCLPASSAANETNGCFSGSQRKNDR